MEMISISEAARRANVGRATIQRKIKNGELSKSINEGGETKLSLDDLARLYPGVTPALPAPASDARAVLDTGKIDRIGETLEAIRTCLRSFNGELIQRVLTTGGRHEEEVSKRH